MRSHWERRETADLVVSDSSTDRVFTSPSFRAARRTGECSHAKALGMVKALAPPLSVTVKVTISPISLDRLAHRVFVFELEGGVLLEFVGFSLVGDYSWW